jgi:tRNA(Arg) A34 adenosine deaminase TadA
VPDAHLPEIRVALPDWVGDAVDFGAACATDEQRMRVAIDLARTNVVRRTGGPFGAAIFAGDRLVAVGVNLVVPLSNSVLHAEMVAFMMAQAKLGTYTLRADGLADHALFTSCEPCAMCLGATLWAGVRRVVWAAGREDANRASFDEGPVFAESYTYLRERGIVFEAGVLRDEGRDALALYGESGGAIYNG